PDGPMVAGSCRVRSPETAVQLCPSYSAAAHVATDVEHARVVRRDEQRRCPLEAVALHRRGVTLGTRGPRSDQSEEVALVIDPRQEAAVAPAVRDVGIVGTRLDVARFSRHVVPLAAIDPARPAARPADARVVLLRAA